MSFNFPFSLKFILRSTERDTKIVVGIVGCWKQSKIHPMVLHGCETTSGCDQREFFEKGWVDFEDQNDDMNKDENGS